MFCTKHFTLIHIVQNIPLFICCEKYIFDNTKADASTDFVLLILFRNISILTYLVYYSILYLSMFFPLVRLRKTIY
jgi:hypothetical protein